ncbi:MAG: glycosyltransferase family 39 protein [Acidobacteria bacterium]|nr:glycosyltransferase family 39 protein [Acidobacteriota bacterium]
MIFGLLLSYLWVFARIIHEITDDEGLLVYPAERILAGQTPYRHFFSELAPGTFYLQALFFNTWGTHVWSARVPVLLVMAAIGWQLFYLSRKIMSPWAAALPALIYGVSAFPRWSAVSHHWYSLFFGLGTTMFLVQYLERRRNYWLFLAGLCTAAAGFCMQNKGAFLLLAAAVILIADYSRISPDARRAWLKGCACFLFGVLLPAMAALLYFHQKNALKELFYATTMYLWQSYLPYEYHAMPFLPSRVWEDIRALSDNYSLTSLGKFVSLLTWSLLIPAAGVIFYLKHILKPRGSSLPDSRRRGVSFAYVVLGLALMSSEMHRFDLVHSLFGAPLLLVLAVALFYDLGFRAVPASRIVASVLVGLALFHFAYGLSLGWRESRRNQPIYTRRGVFYQTPERAKRYQAIIDEVQSRVPDGSGVFVYPQSAILYFLTGTINPTRYDYLLPGETTPAQFEEVIQLLKSNKSPEFVFSFWKERKGKLPHLFPNVPTKILQHHPIEEFLIGDDSPYRPVREAPSFILFEKRPK